jgi:hypothetical protein
MKKAIALLGLLMVLPAVPALARDGHGYPPNQRDHGHKESRRHWDGARWHHRYYPRGYWWPGFACYQPYPYYPLAYEPRPVCPPPYVYPAPWGW